MRLNSVYAGSISSDEISLLNCLARENLAHIINAMSHQTFDLNRSITKKQTVALTGLLMIGFVLVHLFGNLFIYGGAEAYNGWADKLQSLGIFVRIFEFTLLLIVLVHFERATVLVVQNIRAAGGLKRYAVENSRGPRSLTTRLMPYSGTYLLGYLVWHIIDFTLASKAGNNALTLINGQPAGLYGLVVNSFKQPLHAYLYVIAMYALALHLAHGVQSCIQTFGVKEGKLQAVMIKVSNWFAFIIATAYASIPLYVLYLLKV